MADKPTIYTIPAAAFEALWAAHQESAEFDNWECDYGHALGTCPNADCVACNLQRALDAAKPG